MTKNEIDEFIKKAEEITKKVIGSKQKAINFLIKAGFLTKSGKLKKIYRQ